MNYYPFHLGDYAAHTAHLSCDEDIAYRRMLDWYYLTERALPADASQIARVVRMPRSRKAIESVLEEFFSRADDGWHNKRADEELASMRAKHEQQSTKKSHEADRMARFRERRADMFTALRALDIVPAWDVPMKTLQQLFDTHCNGPATDLQREQVVTCNENATAIPTPTPTPTPLKEKNLSGSGRGSRLPADWDPGPTGLAFAASQGLANGVVTAELGKFRDHWAAKSGQDATKADWQAAWRNWCRRAIEMRPPVHHGHGGLQFDREEVR